MKLTRNGKEGFSFFVWRSRKLFLSIVMIISSFGDRKLMENVLTGKKILDSIAL